VKLTKFVVVLCMTSCFSDIRKYKFRNRARLLAIGWDHETRLSIDQPFSCCNFPSNGSLGFELLAMLLGLRVLQNRFTVIYFDDQISQWLSQVLISQWLPGVNWSRRSFGSSASGAPLSPIKNEAASIEINRGIEVGDHLLLDLLLTCRDDIATAHVQFSAEPLRLATSLATGAELRIQCTALGVGKLTRRASVGCRADVPLLPLLTAGNAEVEAIAWAINEADGQASS
jgi:hypothetical protein